MFKNANKAKIAMMSLVIPSMALLISACSTPSGNNAAVDEMLMRASELGIPKHAKPVAQSDACAEAAEVATKSPGSGKQVFTRCRSTVAANAAR
jgi:hypothetical protein